MVWACSFVLTSCTATHRLQKASEGPNKEPIALPIAEPIAEKVKKIIVEKLGVNEAEVTPSARFEEDFGADSLDCVVLVKAFEGAFGIEIPDEDCKKVFNTVKGGTEYLESRVKSRSAPTHS